MNQEGMFYLNRGQRYIYEILPRLLTLISARRFGKTHGVQGPYLIRAVSEMPRGKSAIYCATYKQGLTRTVPETVSAIESITGWRRGVDFYVGCKAPKEARFPDPFVTPFNWEQCIHWFNGHVTHLLSQDVKFSANSLTLDAVLIDEARVIRKEKVDQELSPAVSGTPGMFADCPLKKSIWITTDRPITREGQWVLNRESLYTPDVEEEIKQLICERSYMKTHTTYSAKQIIYNMKLIDEARTRCHLFKEYDTIENIGIVGKDYIDDMRRILPPRIYAISIMNKRIKRASDGFYSAFDEKRHTYIAESHNAMEGYRTVIKPTPENRIKASYETYDFKRIQDSRKTCELDVELDPKQPLNIAIDYNANINWIVTGQRGELNGIRTANVLSSLFVKNERKLRELCKDWCDYYEPHQHRNNRVTYYYNQTAKQTYYANGLTEPFYTTVIRELKSRGWNVTAIDMGSALFHMEKFSMIDDSFKLVFDPIKGTQKYLFPLINKENNEFLIASIENAETTDKYDGFGKNKSGEKKTDSEEDPTELRTDGTDAFDDLIYGMNKFYRSSLFISPAIHISK